MPRNKKPNRKPSKQARTPHPVLTHFLKGDVEEFNRATASALADGSLNGELLKTLTKSVPVERAGDFMNAVHSLAGSATGLTADEDGDAVLVRCEMFSITVTGPVYAFKTALGAKFIELTRVMRACGFSKSQSNIMLLPCVYDLNEVSFIEPSLMLSACRTGLGMTESSSSEDIMKFFPTRPLPDSGIVTRTFFGFRFAEVCDEDSDLFSENFWDRTDVSEKIETYQSLTTSIFGDECVISMPAPWVSTIGNAASMMVEDAMSYMDEDFRKNEPEFEVDAMSPFLRFEKDENLSMIIRLTAEAVVRAWDEIEEVFSDTDDEVGSDADDETGFVEDEDQTLTRLLGLKTASETPREDDTTNLIHFPVRK